MCAVQTTRGVSCDGSGPDSGEVGAVSGRQLVCDKMLQRQKEDTKPNSKIFAQVEDLGSGGVCSVNELSLTLSLLSVIPNSVISSLENVFKQRR